MPALGLEEHFDGWSEGSYGDHTYDHPGVGRWVLQNGLCAADRARSGNAVRFHDEAPAPYLDFTGLDGNGYDGGIGVLSFYYRHWDGDGKDVRFKVQLNDGSGWTDVGPEVDVTSTAYAQHTVTLNDTRDNLKVRILSTAASERLLIDDFGIDAAVLSGVALTAADPVGVEGEGSLEVQVELYGGVTTTADIVQVGGTARVGLDYALSTSTVTLTESAPLQTIVVQVVDDAEPEATEDLVLELVNVSGAPMVTGSESVTLALQDNEPQAAASFTVMSANTTSGSDQAYEAPGLRIFQALQPDVVGIQEFNVPDGQTRRSFVDSAFGTDYHFIVEGGNETIPNGVISRWPITAYGEWNDPQVPNRDFVWATIDVPGSVDLHVVSVHLHSSGGASSRNIEAQALVSHISAAFPSTDYVVLCGDLNVDYRTESAVQTLKTILSDSYQPADQYGDEDTNEPRSKPYDFVLPNPSLDALHVPVELGGRTFNQGVVFDTREWGGSPPAPALAGDSGVFQMQHMAVMKRFEVPASWTNRTTNGVPHWWLTSFGLTDDFEAHSTGDEDGDGEATWAEYISGHDPTNEASFFAVAAVGYDPLPGITVDTRPGRRYEVAFCDDLRASEPFWLAYANPATGTHDEVGVTPSAHTFTDTFDAATSGSEPAGPHRAYRVSVGWIP